MEPIGSIKRDNASITSTSKASFFSRSLIRRDTLRPDYGQVDAPRGPLGLTTLYVPDEVVTSDLIFVHGLNGDAQNTWSKNADPSFFWPKEWLPNDRGFRDIRIHTFGYASAIFKAGGVLNIPDFARSLLGAIQDAPTIPPEHQPPLVLVGHSMGGLVIKKAYILGHQIPEFQPLVNRIKAIFFLATPHQGADIAVTLSRILSVVSPKAQPSFVNDLFPHSPVLQSINDEFPRLCDAAETLQLFSFFETRPMNYGVGKGLIVDKHCAVMNYPRERRTYLDADHRDCARFSSTEDPSYVTVRNALAALLDAHRRGRSKVVEDMGEDRRDALFKFLGSPEIPEDDVLMQDSKRLQGSGQWFLEKESYEKWRDAYSSKLLWLKGRPGAGKSFLAGNVVNKLREQSRDCCSFFFASGNNKKASLNSFLRSMAYQMAMLHPEIHSTVMDLSRKKNCIIDEVDYNQVWRQLYLSGGILKVKLDREQYWVIDALDECKDSAEIMSFLVKAQESWPLCIFVTSREPYEPSMTHRTEVLTATMSDEDNNRDISLFLRNNIDFLPAPTVEAREEMAGLILKRSKGCFLWASLMLKELRQVHTAAETKLVLASNPSDMDDLYLKIVDDMSRARFGKDLAKAILNWTTCSFRPLFKDELHAAIQIDIKDVIDDIEKSVVSCCGNLVFIDNRDRIQLIHTTAREFLLNKELDSEFAVDRTEGHTRLALVCLECLLENGKKRPPRAVVPKKSQLVSYASEYLFQHLVHVKSTNDVVFELLAKFFASTSLLDWIEHIAANSDLRKVYQAGTTITHLLKRRAQHTPGVGHLQKDIAKLEIWGCDLLHLVSKFSDRLRHAPSSIHRLIPPFCPSESIIRKQFCLPNRGLTVHGSSGRSWDECLTTITYPKGTKPLSTAAGTGIFALGMNNGRIVIYDDTIFQEVQTLNHQEPVWLLKFGETGKCLASASAKSIRVWHTESWAEVYKLPIKSLPIALSFVDNDTLLLIATRNNELMHLDMDTGELRDDPINWTRDFEEAAGEGPALHLRQPMMADYSPHQHLLAIIYRGEDILLWDTEQDHIHDMYEKDTGSRSNGSLKLADGATSVRSLAFSSAPDTYLLAATYSDGDLIVYNTWTGEVQKTLPGGNVLALSSSPDGRTLVGAGTMGDIILYDFESLRYLYRVSIANNQTMSKFVLFTSDSDKIIDIRLTQCRIWQPTVLLRQGSDLDDNSDTVSISTGPKELDYQAIDSVVITTFTCINPPNFGPSIIIAGKEDGSVHVYDISGDPTSEQLFVQSSMCAIAELHFDALSGLLTCRDRSHRVTCRKLSRLQRSRWTVDNPVADVSLELTQITQVIASGRHSSILISAEASDSLSSLQSWDGTSQIATIEGHKKPRWLTHPTNLDSLVLVKESSIELRSWTDLSVLQTVAISNLDPIYTSINRIIPVNHPRYFVTVSVQTSQTKATHHRLHVWDFHSLHSPPPKPSLSLDTLSDSIEEIVGVHSDRLIYMDLNYWICSIDIAEPFDVPVRHFFIPNDWLSIVRDELVLDVAKNGDIIFLKQSDLAVIKRGLEVTDGGGTFNPRRKSVAMVPLAHRSRDGPGQHGRPGPSAVPGRHLNTT